MKTSTLKTPGDSTQQYASTAEAALQYAVGDLQSLQADATPMAEIVWRGLLAEAVQLRDRINQARHAMEAETS